MKRISGLFVLTLISNWLLNGSTAMAQIPATNALVVFSPGEAGRIYRIPSLVASRSGTLLAFAESRDGGTDYGNIDIVMKRSTNGGVTWGALQKIGDYKAIIDGTNDLTIGNPTAVVDQNSGKVLLLGITADADESSINQGIGSRRVWVTESSDDGLNWAAWREITASVKPVDWRWYATGPGHGVQIQSGNRAGRLVVPVAFTVPGSGSSMLYSAATIYSDDGGLTWRLGAVNPNPDNYVRANETAVVELTPGNNGNSRLFYNTRDHLGPSPGHRAIAFSSNGGDSFDMPFSAGLDYVTPLSQGSLLRVSYPNASGNGGRIVFSAPNNVNVRKWLSLWVSRDEAATWESPRRIWNGPYSGYSDLAPTPAGDIGVIFEGVINGLLFLTVPVSFLDAAPPSVARPNAGLWTFVELAAGQNCAPNVTNIMDRSPNGYGLNLFADQNFPALSGPLAYQSSTAIGFNGTGGLWLYPNTVGNPFDFGANESFSVETMVRVLPNQTFGAIAAKDWGSKLPGWWFRIQDGGYVRFLVSDSTGAEPSVRSTQKINDGTWHKVVAVRDATNRLLKIYVDGVLSAQAADTTSGTLENGRPLAIGRFNSSSSVNLAADVNFVRIVPAALEPPAFFNWPVPLAITTEPEDSDGDGEPDDIEYAFGSDPSSAASRLQFAISATGTSIGVNYFRLNDPAVNAGVLMSSNLVDWAILIPGITLLQSNHVVQANAGTNGFSVSAIQLNFRDNRPASNRGLFFRLTVSR